MAIDNASLTDAIRSASTGIEDALHGIGNVATTPMDHAWHTPMPKAPEMNLPQMPDMGAPSQIEMPSIQNSRDAADMSSALTKQNNTADALSKAQETLEGYKTAGAVDMSGSSAGAATKAASGNKAFDLSNALGQSSKAQVAVAGNTTFFQGGAGQNMKAAELSYATENQARLDAEQKGREARSAAAADAKANRGLGSSIGGPALEDGVDPLAASRGEDATEMTQAESSINNGGNGNGKSDARIERERPKVVDVLQKEKQKAAAKATANESYEYASESGAKTSGYEDVAEQIYRQKQAAEEKRRTATRDRIDKITGVSGGMSNEEKMAIYDQFRTDANNRYEQSFTKFVKRNGEGYGSGAYGTAQTNIDNMAEEKKAAIPQDGKDHSAEIKSIESDARNAKTASSLQSIVNSKAHARELESVNAGRKDGEKLTKEELLLKGGKMGNEPLTEDVARELNVGVKGYDQLDADANNAQKAFDKLQAEKKRVDKKYDRIIEANKKGPENLSIHEKESALGLNDKQIGRIQQRFGSKRHFKGIRNTFGKAVDAVKSVGQTAAGLAQDARHGLLGGEIKKYGLLGNIKEGVRGQYDYNQSRRQERIRSKDKGYNAALDKMMGRRAARGEALKGAVQDTIDDVKKLDFGAAQKINDIADGKSVRNVVQRAHGGKIKEAVTKQKAAEKAASKGLGLKGKAGAVLGLLAIGGVLGNMMGNGGRQTNAQMYNPNPQPQYYS